MDKEKQYALLTHIVELIEKHQQEPVNSGMFLAFEQLKEDVLDIKIPFYPVE